MNRSIIRVIYFPAILISLLTVLQSCSKDNNINEDDPELTLKADSLKDYSPVVSFDVTGRFLEGKQINCIEPGYKGNTWIACGQDLYHFKNGIEQKMYPVGLDIRDISIAGDESLWVATTGGGLGHLVDGSFTWFTKENSGIPRDYITNVEVGLDGRVWFSSCAADYGGLVVYDGKKFDVFTPDNSILNQHVISDISIDHSGAIYVMTLSKVTRTNVYMISGNSWRCLGNNGGTFYWAMTCTVGPSGSVYLFEDFMLSSTLDNTNQLWLFSKDKWNKVETGFMNSRLSFFTVLKADRRDYCWAVDIEGNNYVLHVFNGSVWHTAPAGLFNNEKITVIETDFDNNIWVGTRANGVFVLKQ